MIPFWLHAVSVGCLLLGVVVALWVAWDESRAPQPMWIMNIVWPVTALFGTVFTLWAYRRYGRMRQGATSSDGEAAPFPTKVGKGALHCGSGCTIGDILAEWLAYLSPPAVVWFGWKTLFEDKIFAVWVLDYVFAFGIGILFQYYSIKPMRKISAGEALVQALKADVLSLTAWQVGMYGFMAIAQFVMFRDWLGTRLRVPTPEFWFVMQLAMLAGFATSYPVNWWLIRRGIKEAM
jgi:hypothetical protein